VQSGSLKAIDRINWLGNLKISLARSKEITVLHPEMPGEKEKAIIFNLDGSSVKVD
jgi:hypothetical protein